MTEHNFAFVEKVIHRMWTRMVHLRVSDEVSCRECRVTLEATEMSVCGDCHRELGGGDA